jgi:uncharacterized RDD family membrane protein YckC
MNEKKYPHISDRVKAVVIDSIVLLGELVLATYIFSLFENVPVVAKKIVFIFIFILYDPILTSFFGGTIGHMIMNIRVRREGYEQQNILLPLAIIRFVVKAFLGWLSLLTVSGNEKRKAIHDMLVGSVVVYKNKE